MAEFLTSSHSVESERNGREEVTRLNRLSELGHDDRIRSSVYRCNVEGRPSH